jgi:F0F1-type ATP synthase delta subunit
MIQTIMDILANPLLNNKQRAALLKDLRGKGQDRMVESMLELLADEDAGKLDDLPAYLAEQARR